MTVIFYQFFIGFFVFATQINDLNCRCYDAQADYWDRFPFPQHLPALLWKNYQQELGRKVLEIGSGTGQFAQYLQERGFDVTCIDPSQEMVSRCQKRGLKTIKTTFQAFETVEKFGIISAILSFIHVPKMEFPEQISKVERLLESNGIFILSLLKGNSEQIEEQSTGYPRFFARYTADEVRLLLKGKFTEIAFHERGNYMLFLFKKNHN